jgi:hypothetical protein
LGVGASYCLGVGEPGLDLGKLWEGGFIWSKVRSLPSDFPLSFQSDFHSEGSAGHLGGVGFAPGGELSLLELSGSEFWLFLHLESTPALVFACLLQ